jgi:hypothetical protein
MNDTLQKLILTAASLGFVQGLHAAENVDIDRVMACADERDDARRLACYDGAVASMKTPAGEAPAAPAPTVAPTPAPKPAAPPVVLAPADEFGVGGSAVARQRRSEQEQENKNNSAETRSITAEVAEVTSRPRGELVITLNNGQVWVQKDPERYSIKPGDQVTIKAGTLGSFHLANGKRSTRVTRVK